MAYLETETLAIQVEFMLRFLKMHTPKIVRASQYTYCTLLALSLLSSAVEMPWDSSTHGTQITDFPL